MSVRVREVGGSNPLAPTTVRTDSFSQCPHGPWF